MSTIKLKCKGASIYDKLVDTGKHIEKQEMEVKGNLKLKQSMHKYLMQCALSLLWNLYQWLYESHTLLLLLNCELCAL